jgi:hypothetical protein
MLSSILFACPLWQHQENERPSSTPLPATSLPPAIPTPVPTPTPLVNPVPTPSLTPPNLPTGCSVEEVRQRLEAFLAAFNGGALRTLREFVPAEGETTSPSWFAVAARDEAGIATSIFTTDAGRFLAYLADRHAHGERLEPLEFIAIQPLDNQQASASRVSVTVVLLRQAPDLLARPVLAQVQFSCPDRTILLLSLGDASSPGVPENPESVLIEALQQRSLALPEVQAGACPRSPWAFGLAVGHGPVYLAIGPDAVVNLGGPLATLNDDGSYQLDAWWFVPPHYPGPLLIRGRQLDGSAQVLLAGRESHPADRLVLPIGTGTAPSEDGTDWRSWPAAIIVPGPGCYALQVDGIEFQDVLVLQVVEGQPDDLLPISLPDRLPHDLVVLSAFRSGPDQVRLALWSESLVIRLSIGLSGPGPLELAGATECVDMVLDIGPMCWEVDHEHGWPRTAVWDDGRRRYHLVVLAAAPGTWSYDALATLVQALSQASSSATTP